MKRELRLQKGQGYQAAHALETERNLRRLTPIALARVIPLNPTTSACPDDSVEVLILTRDLWSLRLESQFDYNGGVLNYLNLGLRERNFLGLGHTLGLQTQLTPFILSSGLT